MWTRILTKKLIVGGKAVVIGSIAAPLGIVSAYMAKYFTEPVQTLAFGMGFFLLTAGLTTLIKCALETVVVRLIGFSRRPAKEDSRTGNSPPQKENQ